MFHRRTQRHGLSAALLGLVATLGTVAAQPSIEHHTKIRLAVRAMSVAGEKGDDSGVGRMVLEPGRAEGASRLDLRWPGAEDRCFVELRASALTEASGRHVVELRASLHTADGRRIDSARTVALHDRSTTLFEVYRRGERSLTLAIEAEAIEEEVISARPSAKEPVRFKVEVLRVAGGDTVSLEDNFLNTFIGDPVFYEFDLGAEADSVRLTLNPVRVTGAVAEIEVGLSGSLPDVESGEPRVLARTERWLASRNATSTLSLETGDPPTGYRFLVTARF